MTVISFLYSGSLLLFPRIPSTTGITLSPISHAYADPGVVGGVGGATDIGFYLLYQPPPFILLLPASSSREYSLSGIYLFEEEELIRCRRGVAGYLLYARLS